jgi:hypothetical protein
MKNEKLLCSIGNIADKYIAEAQPVAVQPQKSKVVMLFRKTSIRAAAVAASLLLCAFTYYIATGGDLWLQQPAKNPTETVRSAIENQVGKDYTIRIEGKSFEIDEVETARVVERFISGVIAERRSWSDEYLAEHFIVVKAVYYAEYDHTQTTRSDGDVVQYFYLTRDIQSKEWTIVDNSGNMNRPNEKPDLETGAALSLQEQIESYLTELFNEAYTPYYDGLHYEISNYEEIILDDECAATFLWTMYHLGKGWDVASDEGVETQGNFNLQATATLNSDGELDVSTLIILADSSAVGAPNYNISIEDFFPDQLTTP